MKASEGFLHVIKPGFYSTIQDKGRPGYGMWGIPSSGAADRISFDLANRLLNNDPNSACLEMTVSGGEYQFNGPTNIVLTGAQTDLYLNGSPIELNTVYHVKKQDELQIGRFEKGARMYLGVYGGFKTEEVLGSRSWFKGITKDIKLNKFDSLSFKRQPKPQDHHRSSVKPNQSHFTNNTLEVYKGPESTQLSSDQMNQLLNEEFEISQQQNRMGVQLSNLLPNELKEIITVPVYTGTVQLTPNGRIIILMQDAQVTGGYPRIFQLSDPIAISTLAQKQPGQKIKFKLLQNELEKNEEK